MAYLYTDGNINTSARNDGTGKPITDINLKSTSIALPVDVQQTNLQATLVTLNAGLAITNTSLNWIATEQDWSKYKQTVLRVDNTHDQPVELVIHQQGIGSFNKLDGTSHKVTIPTNTSRVLVTPSDWSILGQTIAETLAMSAQCTVAPTSGTIVISAYFVPLS